MRILVVSELPPYVMGGAENQMARLVSDWLARGHSIECMGRRMPEGHLDFGPHRIRTHAISVLQGFGRAGRGLSYVRSLGSQLLKLSKQADLIYCRFIGDAVLTACLLKSLGLLKLPLVCAPATAGPGGDVQYLHSIPLFGIWTKMLFRQCDAVVCIAPAIRAEMLQLGFAPDRCPQIPNGIVIQSPPVRLGGAVPQLLFTGRFAHQKGLDILLDAVELLQEQGLRFTLSLVGEGPLRGWLAETVRAKHLEACVSIESALPPESIRERLQKADIFVLPSRAEGFSNAALEALEAGLPVVMSDCGGLDTYIQPETGRVVPRGDVCGLAAALAELLALTPIERKCMGIEAHTLAKHRFSMEAVSKANLGLFEKLSDKHAT